MRCGIHFVKIFLRGLRVKEELESAVGIEMRDGRFTVGGMLVSLLYAVIRDMRRQSHTWILRFDKAGECHQMSEIYCPT